MNKYVDHNCSGSIDAYELEQFFNEQWLVPSNQELLIKDLTGSITVPIDINE